MKVIVAGSRSICNYSFVSASIDSSGFLISEIISGVAKGVDLLGEKYAREHNIPIKQFYPDWNKYGKSAGFIRNKQMVDYADAVICIWDGVSKGTKHTIDLAKKYNKKLRVFRYA